MATLMGGCSSKSREANGNRADTAKDSRRHYKIPAVEGAPTLKDLMSASSALASNTRCSALSCQMGFSCRCH